MKKTICIIFIALVLILSGCSRPDPSLQTVKYKGYFTAGYDPDKQLTYQGEGLLIDIIKEAANRMELEAPIYPVESHTWQAHLHNKDIDVMLGAENEEDLKTISVYQVETLLIKPTGTTIGEGSVIGVLDAGACYQAAENHSKFSNASYQYYASVQELLSDLKLQVVDAIIMGKLEYLKHDVEGSETETIHGKDFYITLRKDDQSFLGVLNETLYGMYTDGTIDKLVEAYTE